MSSSRQRPSSRRPWCFKMASSNSCPLPTRSNPRPCLCHWRSAHRHRLQKKLPKRRPLSTFGFGAAVSSHPLSPLFSILAPSSGRNKKERIIARRRWILIFLPSVDDRFDIKSFKKRSDGVSYLLSTWDQQSTANDSRWMLFYSFASCAWIYSYGLVLEPIKTIRNSFLFF